MKIPLLILEDKLQVNSILKCPLFRLYGQVVFIVDTGSPLTMLSEGDALKLKVPIGNLRDSPIDRKHIYMGGSISEIKLIPKQLDLVFKDDQSKAASVTLPNICVALSTKHDNRHKQIAQGSPSIMGLDFLRDNGFTLVVDPKKNIAYLEK